MKMDMRAAMEYFHPEGEVIHMPEQMPGDWKQYVNACCIPMDPELGQKGLVYL